MPDEPKQPLQDFDEPEKPVIYTRDLIDEALAKKAASQAPREPVVITTTVQPLPRQPKPARERKKRRIR